MSNIERSYKEGTLAEGSHSKRIKKGDGQVNTMRFLSPMYASGVGMCEPSQPHGFDGSIRDPMGYFDNPNFLASPYGRPGKSKKRD